MNVLRISISIYQTEKLPIFFCHWSDFKSPHHHQARLWVLVNSSWAPNMVLSWAFHIWGYPKILAIAGCFTLDNRKQKWMITRGSPHFWKPPHALIQHGRLILTPRFNGLINVWICIFPPFLDTRVDSNRSNPKVANGS